MTSSETLGRKHVVLKARPTLRTSTLIQGGRSVFVVNDPLSLRYFHLEEPQHFILINMDGRHSLEEIRRAYETQYRPQRLTLEEVEDFARQMLQAGLVEAVAGTADQALQCTQEQERRRSWSRLLNIFYVKLPLANPDRLLAALRPFGHFLFHPATFVLGFVLAVAAGLGLLAHRDDFVHDLPTFREFLTWRYGLHLAVAFVIIKVLHELGHALCAKSQGIEVPEIGVAFLFFVPTLYCNVSDSWRLPERWKRNLINLAGMWVELLVAAAAVLLWRLTSAGHVLHSFALHLVIVCGVHTILFNANPLMRFDGYFVLSDWLAIPNLAERSQRQLRAALARWFGTEPVPDTMPGPRRFLLIYGLASLLYRTVVTVTLLWLFVQFMKERQMRWIGLTLAVLASVVVFAIPLYRLFQLFAGIGRSAQMKMSHSFLTVGLLVFVVALVFYIPFPLSVGGTGVVQLEPDHCIHVSVPPSGGFLEELFVHDGQHVRQGDVLGILRNPEVESKLALIESDLSLRDEQQQAFVANLANDQASAQHGYAEIEHEMRALAEQRAFLKRDKAGLLLRAPRDGVVVRLPSWETRGKWLPGGEVLFAVGDPTMVRAVVLLAAAERQLVEEGRATRFLPHGATAISMGHVTGIAPADSITMPLHLAGRFGGEVASRHDPETKIEKPLKQHYLVTLDVSGQELQPGVLGDVRVEVGSATLWWRVRRFLGTTFQWVL